MKDTDRLMRMKEEANRASAAQSKAEGRLEQLMKSLKDDHGYKTEEAARKEQEKLVRELSKDKATHETNVDKVEAAYPWGTL